MTSLWRALWLASGDQGRSRESQPGFTPADARYLLWLTAHVRDQPKLDTSIAGRGVDVLHKAGWISAARHDTGLVFWEGGVFVAGVMTYRSYGVSTSSDRLAGPRRGSTLAAFPPYRRVTGALGSRLPWSVQFLNQLWHPTTKARTVSENENTISLLLVPLEDIVVFPNMNVTLTVDVGDEDRVLLVPKHEDEYAKVGTVAEVTDRIRLPAAVAQSP